MYTSKILCVEYTVREQSQKNFHILYLHRCSHQVHLQAPTCGMLCSHVTVCISWIGTYFEGRTTYTMIDIQDDRVVHRRKQQQRLIQLTCINVDKTYRVPQKVSNYTIWSKNRIKSIKACQWDYIYSLLWDILCVTYFLTLITMPDP